jgi:hypothetical protein
VGDHVLDGRGNPDGIHWGWEGHELVGKALAEQVGTLLDLDGPFGPGNPGVDHVG